jgi:MYXO-CTERM domain-containing protein
MPELANEAKTISDYRIFDEPKRHFKSPLLPSASRGYVQCFHLSSRMTMKFEARQRNRRSKSAFRWSRGTRMRQKFDDLSRGCKFILTQGAPGCAVLVSSGNRAGFTPALVPGIATRSRRPVSPSGGGGSAPTADAGVDTTDLVRDSCNCLVAGTPSSPTAPLAAMVTLMLAVASRRRRRR